MKLKEISLLLNGRLEGDPELEIHGVNGIEEAMEGEITLLSHKKYLGKLGNSKCAAVIAPLETNAGTNRAVIYVKNPYLAFARLLEAFYPPKEEVPHISPKSAVSESAALGNGVRIYPMVYVGDGVTIGDRSVLYPGVYVGDNTRIGDNSVIYANVSIYPGTVIGNRVAIHSGTVIGSDGFGYVVDEHGRRKKVPQVGRVVIEDEVEIGANTCIDRATIGETRIRKGAKLDNLIQIAHNCTIGEDSVMAAQVGISGSCRVGKRVMMGGQVGVADHVEIGDDAMIAAQSGVPSDLEGKQVYAGSPTIGHGSWRRAQMALPKLPDLIKKVRALEKLMEKPGNNA